MAEEGEEQPQNADEDLDSVFRFFNQLAELLVLEIRTDDRGVAAAWVQRLQQEPESDAEKALRVNYIKLLVFVMQRGKLVGMFKQMPPAGPLQSFPSGADVSEMGNLLLEQADLQGSGDSDRGVPYTMDISNDLREFVAAQEIPDFGYQMYYAWSTDDPIHKWSSFDEKKFPQHVRDKIQQIKDLSFEDKMSTEPTPKREKTDSSSRRSCDSSIVNDKPKILVKSPQEIEKSQDRTYNLPGSASDKPAEEKSWVSIRKSLSSKRESVCPSFFDKDKEMQNISRICSGMCGVLDTKAENEKSDAADVESTAGAIRSEKSSSSTPRMGRSTGCECSTKSQRKTESEGGRRLQFKQQ